MRSTRLPTVVASALLVLISVALGLPAPGGAFALRPRRRGRQEREARSIAEELSRSSHGRRSSGGSDHCSECASQHHLEFDNRTSAACAPGEKPRAIGTAETRPDVSRSPPLIVAAGTRTRSGVATRPHQKGFVHESSST